MSASCSAATSCGSHSKSGNNGAAGELPENFDCDEIAAFMVSALQGANLLSTAHRNPPARRAAQAHPLR
jgi:hypothetical protein